MTNDHSSVNPMRVCPICGAAENLDNNDKLFPADWRCISCSNTVLNDKGIPILAPELADTFTGMDPDSFGDLLLVEDTHFWFVCRGILFVNLINKYFPNAKSYFEIGCGNGAVLLKINEIKKWNRLVGTELHPSGLINAVSRIGKKVEFLQLDARKIPIKNEFELVGAFDVIEHIEEDELVLSQLYQAMKHGGGLIISVPQHMFMWSASDETALHARRYNPGEMEKKLNAAGFEVQFSTSYISILFPLMYISRWINRNRKMDQNDILDNEFRRGELVNKIMKSITKFEIWISSKGFSWPFGGSRVIVCKKR